MTAEQTAPEPSVDPVPEATTIVPADTSPVVAVPATDDDTLSDVEYRPDGSINARVNGQTYKLGPPGLDDLFALWDAVEAIDDQITPRSTAILAYLSTTQTERAAATERGDIYIPSAPPERHTKIERDIARLCADWMRQAFEKLAGPLPEGFTAPSWFSNAGLPRTWVTHWRDVPLSPS